MPTNHVRVFSEVGGTVINGTLYGAVVLLALIGPGAGTSEPQPPWELESRWAELGTGDPVKAHQAIAALAAKAARTVPFLQERLRAVPLADPRRLARLIDDLDSSQFPVRQSATHELESLAESAGPSLRRALTNRPSSELRRRIEQVLATHKAQRLNPPPDQVRLARAIEVLEQIADPAARRLLAALAQGAPEATLTRDAKGALDRLSKRPATAP
jgi:hypothetical protein